MPGADKLPSPLKAKKLFAQNCEFVAGAARIEDIPTLPLPEVAFAGRSNVGKSSLINALVGRRALARISQTPGRTRQVNFFSLNNQLMLVDLPGYGYAKASKKDIAGWGRLINDYLIGRPNLRRVCMLIDARRGVKESDTDVMKVLDEMAVPYQILLTKRDKVSKEECEKILENIANMMHNYPALHPEVLITSAKESIGIEDIRITLAAFVEGL
jgi:GTP-binding protein